MKILITIFIAETLIAAFNNPFYSARPLALANAYTSIHGCVYSGFYNPSALAKMEVPEISISYGLPHYGLWDKSYISQSSLAIGMPLLIVNIGVLYSNLSLTDIYTEEIFAISLSKSLFKFLSVGTNFKLMNIRYFLDMYYLQDIVFAKGSHKQVFDFDVGMIFSFKTISVGLSYKNLINPVIDISENFAPSRVGDIISFGLSYSEDDFTTSANVSKIDYNFPDTVLSVGVEKNFFNKLIALRGGYLTNITHLSREKRNITCGIGLNVLGLKLDYGLKYPITGIKNTYGTHYLTFGIEFPKRFIPEMKVQKPKEKAFETEVIRVSILPSTPTIPILTEVLSFKEPVVSSPTIVNIAETVKPQPTPQPVQVEPKLEEKTREVIKIVYVEKKEEEKFPRLHTVREGENLSTIARKYYNDPKKWHKIYEANKEKIDKGVVKPGQVLIIPK